MLAVIFGAIGLFVWCRMRRRRSSPRLPVDQREGEESIPLNARLDEDGEGEEAFRQRPGKGKGKERAVELAPPPIFDVGESDDEEVYHDKDEYKG